MHAKSFPILLVFCALMTATINCATFDVRMLQPATASATGEAASQSVDGALGTSQSAGVPQKTSLPNATAESQPTENVGAIKLHAELSKTIQSGGKYVLWSPDGKSLIVGGRLIEFFDTLTFEKKISIQADRWVYGISLSPDGKVLAAIDESRGLILFDAATGSELRTISNSHSDTVSNSGSFPAFSPDSATVAVIIGDVVKLYKVATGEEITTLIPHGENGSSFFSASALAFTSDGKSLIVGGGSVAVLDVATGEQTLTFGNVGGTVSHMALSPDGKKLVTAGVFNNEPITVWETATGHQLRTFRDPSADTMGLGVTGMAFAPDGLVLATASSNTSINLWDVTNGVLIQTLVGPTQPSTGIAFSPDGKTLATATGEEEGLLRLWAISTGDAVPAPTTAATSDAPGAAVGPTAIPLSPRAISAANAAQVKKLSALNVSESGNLVWSPDGFQLVIGGRKIHFFDTRTMKESNSLAYEIGGLAISPNSKILAAAGYQGVVLFDMGSASELLTLANTRISTSALSNSFLAFSPDSAKLAVIIGDVVKLYRTSTGEELNTIVAQGSFHIAISPDGTELYAVGWGHSVTVWDLATGKNTRSIGNSSISIDNMVLSSDGAVLATYSFDGSIVLWEAHTGRQLRTISGSNSFQSNALAFSPDGSILASVSEGVTIKLWDASSGKLLATLVGHSENIQCIAFSPDGATLASSNYSNGVYLWGLPQ